MSKSLPARADVVIIGGGIVGCSIAYHLTREGITNVVVLERKQLTSGTTWHAAGLVGQLRATRNLTELAKYTTTLFEGLEKETGQATFELGRGHDSASPLRASAARPRLACFLTDPGDTPSVLAMSASLWSR